MKKYYDIGKNLLFPICRSITGNGTKKTLQILKSEFPSLKIKKIKFKRNEKYLKVYDFETGKGFEPDFILILIGGIKYDLCQLFVEPKGSDRLLSIDEVWKEKFIEQIYKLSEIDSSILHNNKNVKFGGFKFFNKENEIRDIFVKDFHYKIDMLN